MLRLITDFDGPIMDVSERYYQVYQYCLSQCHDHDQSVSPLTKAEFWKLKRAQVPERQIGRISGLYEDQSRQFAKLRRETVHSLPYLTYDQPIPGAIATLERIQQHPCFELVVMTMRRVQELQPALNRYDLGRFFPPGQRYCLPDDYIKTQDVADKPQLMAQALAELPEAAQTWMVGDTEADIIAAQTHQIPIVSVLSGIRDRTRLSAHNPDFIVENLGAAVDLILRQTLQTAET